MSASESESHSDENMLLMIARDADRWPNNASCDGAPTSADTLREIAGRHAALVAENARLKARVKGLQKKVGIPNIKGDAEGLEAERDRLKKDLYVPGAWRCAKCNFTLIQSNLNAQDGSVTARDDAGDKCPNDGSPLWRVTYKQWANEQGELAEAATLRHIDEQARLKARVEELEAAISRPDAIARMERLHNRTRGLKP